MPVQRDQQYVRKISNHGRHTSGVVYRVPSGVQARAGIPSQSQQLASIARDKTKSYTDRLAALQRWYSKNTSYNPLFWQSLIRPYIKTQGRDIFIEPGILKKVLSHQKNLTYEDRKAISEYAHQMKQRAIQYMTDPVFSPPPQKKKVTVSTTGIGRGRSPVRGGKRSPTATGGGGGPTRSQSGGASTGPKPLLPTKTYQQLLRIFDSKSTIYPRF